MSPRALRLDELVSLLGRDSTWAQSSPDWGWSQIAGRFVELSGHGTTALLTAALGLVRDAQRLGEPTAWITLPRSTFFPPDAAEGGVDLETLAIVRAPDPRGAARSAVQLTRSGGFGLVVMDFGPKLAGLSRASSAAAFDISLPLQTKLVGLAQKHDTAVVVLTEKPADSPSLGSLVSLRAEVNRVDVNPDSPRGKGADAYQVQVRVLKDKRRGPGKVHVEVCHGPPGLC
jgi:recombination protein RecA